MVDSSVKNVTICIKQVRDLQQHLESESNSTETTEGSEPSTALHRGLEYIKVSLYQYFPCFYYSPHSPDLRAVECCPLYSAPVGHAQISPKELIIFLAVVALWVWACALFYLRSHLLPLTPLRTLTSHLSFY